MLFTLFLGKIKFAITSTSQTPRRAGFGAPSMQGFYFSSRPICRELILTGSHHCGHCGRDRHSFAAIRTHGQARCVEGHGMIDVGTGDWLQSSEAHDLRQELICCKHGRQSQDNALRWYASSWLLLHFSEFVLCVGNRVLLLSKCSEMWVLGFGCCGFWNFGGSINVTSVVLVFRVIEQNRIIGIEIRFPTLLDSFWLDSGIGKFWGEDRVEIEVEVKRSVFVHDRR